MVALRICVLVCGSTEQFPKKSVFIKTVSVTSSNLQSTIDVFYSAQEGMPLCLYIRHWRK